jgi:hypothetical protein
MKGALNAPDGKRPHPPRNRRNRRDKLEDRRRETLLRHEGLAPVRLQGSKPVRALFQADVFLPDIGSIGLSFSMGSSVPVPGL